jgi:opacity protein-like surface antigen
MRKIAMFLGAVLAVAMLGVASAADSVTVNLDALNNSGVSGTAVLTAMGNQTQVVLTVTGEPAGASEPAHIHTGNCGPTLGGVKFPLKNVEGGTSTTLVATSLASLETGGYAINVHESAANIKNYVACGNIPAMAATSMPKAGGLPIEAIVLTAGALVGVGYVLRRRTVSGN